MTDLSSTEPDPPLEPAVAPEVAPEEPAVDPVQLEGEEPASVETPEVDQPVVEPDPVDLVATTDDGTVEVELNGLTYRVPAALRDGYMMHADYTSKTQEVAGKGRALDSEREAFTQQAQNHRDNIGDFGELAHAEKLLDSFREVDFPALQQEDADQAQQLAFQYQKLRDDREKIVGRIQKREHEARVTAERSHANRRDQLTATLARDIPNYSPALQKKMDETAIRGGFTRAELNSVTDPKTMRILHLAHLGEQVLQRTRAAKVPPVPAPAKPVPKVTGGKTPTAGPQDKQSVDDWMDSRDKQLRQSSG